MDAKGRGGRRALTTKQEWQGRVGRSWAENADAQDARMEEAGLTAMEALGDLRGARVLDLGCGAGATCFQLAERIGAAGMVEGVDVSPQLLERAQARHAARGAPGNIRLSLADAAEWQAEAPLDALFSRCGAMFFDRPAEVYAHLRAQMRPGARLGIAAWAERERCGWAAAPIAFTEGLLPKKGPVTPGEPGPFAWARIEPVLAMLRAAGWKRPMARRFDHMAPMALGEDPDPVERAILASFRIGPVAAALAAAPEDLREAARARMREGYAAHVVGQGPQAAVMLPASAWIVTAEA